MADFLAKVRAQLDATDAENKLNSLCKKRTIDVDLNINTSGLDLSNILNQIRVQFQSAGVSVGQNFAKNINTAIGNINVTNAKSQIEGLKSALQGLNFNDSAINNVTRELSNMDVAVTKISQHISGNHLTVQVDGIDQLGRAVTEIKSFDTATGNLSKTSKTVSESFKQMFTSTDTSKLSATIASLDANFVKLKGTVSSESATLKTLKSDLDNIGKITGLENQQAEFERITREVQKLSIAYKEAKAEAASVASAQQLMSGKNILNNQITTWMNNNTKAAKIYSTQLQQLQAKLSSVSNAGGLKAVATQFRELQTTAAAAGNLGNSVFGQLIGNMTKLSPLFGMGTAIMTTIRGVKDMISTVYELDTALVDLQKTTTMNSSDLESFYSSANSIAKEMGVTTAEIINQASAWSRLGYSSKEAAEGMAALSSQFAAISPGMNVETATDGLVSIMKAYNIDTDDVLDGIMSKINIIGNTAATSNADIVNMLTRSSSAMAEANNTLEQTIALETAAVEITQDADSVGTAFKTISMRIRGRQSLPPYSESYMPRYA